LVGLSASSRQSKMASSVGARMFCTAATACTGREAAAASGGIPTETEATPYRPGHCGEAQTQEASR
jgi:hypothetical protein